MGSVAMEEYELMKDTKYRLYVSAVDKALKSFESTNEWPDLISSLGKLNKVIKDYQRFPVIPRRIKISKRLAQCMHITLPAGVHLKALETYDIIFKCMGTNRLSHELFIYSAGLFPLLGHSAINVKPPLLTIYETHFVPLGPRLLPGLSGFLSGVLPGLEEGSDHFERTNALLEKVCDGVGPTAFYGCLWQCVAGNAAVRLPAVTFALSHFNKKLSMEDQQHIMGTSIDVMVKALCAGMQDLNALVQRTSLDLLLVGFPMHNTQLVPSDMTRLVTAALSAILRRDMSLNRRLYAWLLGSELNLASLPPDHPYVRQVEELPEAPKTSIYFDMYSRDYLIEGVKVTLNEMSSDIRPYRLLTSLLDKPDVGPVILDDILFDVFRVLYHTCKAEDNPGSPKRKQDIMKSANLFFNSLESWYIWQYLGSLFDQACRMNSEENLTVVTKFEVVVKPVGGGMPNLWEVCEVCEFLLGVIPVEVNMESPGEHLMNLLLRLVALLMKYLDSFSQEQLCTSLTVCRTLLKKMLPRRKAKPEPTLEVEPEKPGEPGRPPAVRAVIEKEKDQGETAPETLEDIPNKPEKKVQETEFGLMLKSFLKDFQTFFVAFVSGGRIINNSCVPQAFEKLKKSTGNSSENYADELRKLLSTVIADRETRSKGSNRAVSVSDSLDLDLVAPESHLWNECFEIACGTLVDASLFPLCFSNEPADSVVLPPWVKTLLVCCCYLDKSPLLQLTAIRTLLELVQLSECWSEENSDQVTALFSTSQIFYLQKNTNIVKIVTEVLWMHLGQLSPQLQVNCIELLHQLLNTFTVDDSVERILGESLLRGDEAARVDALLRFIKLWTIGRELQDGRQKRCFQTCLLKILDSLLLANNSPLRLQTEAWLRQALMRGDIARLLDPLLLILLDPATARLGILHVSIEPSTSEPSSDETPLEDTSKIYAISSVDGNVIYHVSDVARRDKTVPETQSIPPKEPPAPNAECFPLEDPSLDPNPFLIIPVVDKDGFPKRLKWRWKKEPLSEQRVFTVTSLKGSPDSQLRYITEKNVARGIELPRPCNGQVSLFVNPLNGREDDDLQTDLTHAFTDVIRNARRFNPGTGSVENGGDEVADTVPKLKLEVSTQESPERFFVKNKFLEHDCEESESADEFFGGKGGPSSAGYRIARDIVDSLVDSVVRKCELRVDTQGVGVHPLHSHLLLYCGVYDSTRTLYAFNALRNILFTCPRLFLWCSATSGTVGASFPSDLLVMLARHRKSVFGRSFEGSVSAASDNMSTFRSSMYLEVLVVVCLYYARSYYPNLGHRLTADVLAGNRLVQLTSIETLTDILSELIPLVRESGKGLASYIATILAKCKVQRIVLHCVMSSLSAIQQQQFSNVRIGGRTFTEEIIDFNDTSDGTSLTEHSRALQLRLLKLVLALIKLEYYVDSCKSEAVESNTASSGVKEGTGSTLDASYSPGYLIPHQPLFYRAVGSALSLKGSMRGLHSHWADLVTSSLPYLGSALPQIVMNVITQLCVNIEELASIYANPNSEEELPPDYAITQLEALTVLCHYCVLDSSQQMSPLALTAAGSGGSSGVAGPNPGQILNNLVHVFTPLPLMQELSKERTQHQDVVAGVRRSVLSRMPSIIASLSALWTAVSENPISDEIAVWGSPRVVRSQILEFLSPLSLHHGPCFLAAIAVAWHERRSKISRQVLPVPTAEQEVLVQLVGSIKVMPIDTLVQTVHQVLKQPPAVEGSLQDMCLEVSVLELFYVYMQTSSGAQLGECWTSLLTLLKDGLLLLPPALFLVLAILNEFVQRSPPFQEKKDQRDLQDITAKLVEACGEVAGACLEQTTWLKRNISVKDLDSIDDDSPSGQASPLQHSAQAQLVLAQILASLLDVSYGSQEKEKVATLLIAVMCNVTPYLKNHQARYAANFQACSQLLANISGFPYTRKAWKKDAFELLLDPALFQMGEECLPYWTTIVDNLMTHDQTTFQDLMSRISMAQSGSYNLFSSRELEYEQRAQLLKRLAFVIMCSETDQYIKSMNNIQERLSESLRLPQVVPSIQAQVFFCFRVLLLRMSPHHVTGLWPIIISEMVQVFMHIEQELTNDTEEFSSHIKVMSALDSSWVVNSSNGLNAHGHPHWLLLTLAAAKLLDLAVLLPANHLPQFQMYRWAFVGDHQGSSKPDSAVSHDFIPHVKRICKLMDEKYGRCEVFVRAKEGHLLLTDTSIESLQQLHPFFHSLQTRAKSTMVDISAVEKHIFNDFLDKIPTSPVH